MIHLNICFAVYINSIENIMSEKYKRYPIHIITIMIIFIFIFRTPIPLSDGSGYKFDIGSNRGILKVQLRLPETFACDHCVLQVT